MADTNTPDRTDPDHNWTGNAAVASNHDVADAIAHMKAWFAREIAAVKAAVASKPAPAAIPPAPVVTANPTSGTSGA